jgi:hypothetical protein
MCFKAVLRQAQHERMFSYHIDIPFMLSLSKHRSYEQDPAWKEQ